MSEGDGVDPAPFDLEAGDGSVAALCLHGLTGTPYEIRPVGEALARAGVRAVGPALPGHNSTAEELARQPWESWVEAARRELLELRRVHERVFVVGLSMGGLVTLALASEEPVDAFSVIGTPLRFRAPLPQLLPIAKRVRPFLPKRGGSDIRSAAARARHPGYDVMPLAAVHELTKLQRHVRRGLRRIEAPALVAHGAHDHTANVRDAHELHERLIGSELLLLERSGHVVPVDHDGEMLAERVCEFFGRRR